MTLKSSDQARINIITGKRKKQNLCHYCGLDNHCLDGNCENLHSYEKVDMRDKPMPIKTDITERAKMTIRSHRRRKGLCERCGVETSKDCLDGICIETWERSDMRELIKEPEIAKSDTLHDKVAYVDVVVYPPIPVKDIEITFIASVKTIPSDYQPKSIQKLDKKFIFIDLRDSDEGYRIKWNFIEMIHGHFPDLLLVLSGRPEKNFKPHEILKIQKIPNLRFSGSTNCESILDYACKSELYISYPNEVSCLGTKFKFKSFTLPPNQNASKTITFKINLTNVIKTIANK